MPSTVVWLAQRGQDDGPHHGEARSPDVGIIRPRASFLGSSSVSLAGATLSGGASPTRELLLAISTPVGQLWLDAPTMTVVPLVFSLLVTGVESAASSAAAGSVATRAMLWFVVLLVAACALSATLTTLALAWVPISPAAAHCSTAGAGAPVIAEAGAWFSGIIPANPVKAAAEMSMAPLVVFALFFGFAASRIDAPLRGSLTTFFEAVVATMLVIVRWVLLAGPVGVLALGFGVGVQMGLGAAGALAHYVLIVVAASPFDHPGGLCPGRAGRTYLSSYLAKAACRSRPWPWARSPRWPVPRLLAVLGASFYLLGRGGTAHGWWTPPAWRIICAQPWRLWTGLGLLAWSFLGRSPITWLLAKPDSDPTRPERGDHQMIASPTGSTLYVEISGPADAPPVILTHGWGLDSTIWYYLRRDLAKRFRVIVWDLPGLGRSRAASGKAIDLSHFAQDLKALLALTDGKPAVLVGHSIGGMTLQTLVRDHPEVLAGPVAGLVMVNTTYTNPLRTMVLSGLAQALRWPCAGADVPLGDLAATLGLAQRVARATLSGSAHLANRLGFAGEATRSQLEHNTLLATRNPPAALARGNLAMFRWDAHGALQGIAAPILILAGDSDLVTKREASQVLAQAARSRSPGGDFQRQSHGLPGTFSALQSPDRGLLRDRPRPGGGRPRAHPHPGLISETSLPLAHFAGRIFDVRRQGRRDHEPADQSTDRPRIRAARASRLRQQRRDRSARARAAADVRHDLGERLQRRAFRAADRGGRRRALPHRRRHRHRRGVAVGRPAPGGEP